MATPAEAIVEIDAALAAGVLTVSFGSRSTTYRSVDDLLRARAHFASLIESAAGTGQSYRLAAARKGV